MMTRYLLAFLFGCFVLSQAVVCVASGTRKVTFDQTADCAFITGFQVSYEPTSKGDTVPSATASGFSIANVAPLVCGLGANFTFTANGVGNYRFWLQGVAADGSVSAFSNFVDAPLPFAVPVLKSVGP